MENGNEIFIYTFEGTSIVSIFDSSAQFPKQSFSCTILCIVYMILFYEQEQKQFLLCFSLKLSILFEKNISKQRTGIVKVFIPLFIWLFHFECIISQYQSQLTATKQPVKLVNNSLSLYFGWDFFIVTSPNDQIIFRKKSSI